MKWMLPREHGAYAQLLFPLIAALALSRPGLASVGVLLGALLTFWAHEPVLVAIGQRGARRQEEGGRDAWILALGLGGAGLLALAAVAWASAEARPWLVLPLVLGAAVGVLVLLGREKTAVGELLAAAALGAWAVPLAVAGGVPPRTALLAWQALTAGFWIADLAVRVVIHAGKNRLTPAARWTSIATALLFPAAFVGLDALEHAPAALALSVVPFSVFGIALTVAPPHARNLKRIGWGLVGASVVATGIVVAVLRPS